MKDKVIEIVKDILIENGVELNFEINENTNLRELGLTSFDLATLTVMIEDEFGIDVFENGIVYTIKDIVLVLAK
uniref:acyl carrier protein n=1 Tax=Algoriphagus sp. TaxID=1872435 RepID=UPI00404822A8